MNFADFSIKKKVIIWTLIILIIAGGIFAYNNLARYEDPEFTIKEAMVNTTYPGGTPKEVEEEVTEKIEKKIQEMGQIKRLESLSRYGASQITVVIKDKYTKKNLPQIWDELRRKVHDAQVELPPGAGPSQVNDDYGDVYGMYYAVTGDGYSYRELKDYTDELKRELSLVPGVAKVVIAGERQETIFVDISRTRMSQLGMSLEQIYQTIESQNLVSYSGEIKVGDEYLRITPTGTLDSVQAISNILIRSPKSKKLIYLNDIAFISRDYEEVPHALAFYNGKPALTLGISIVSGGNVVKIGHAIQKRLTELSPLIPVGVQVHKIYDQPEVVTAAINGFMVSLLEALAIVIVVLLLFMGLRSGFIIGSILLLTVLGTLFVMYLFGIALERISLGALIIALGMLVDNAIVVTEGILVKVQQGIDTLAASRDVVNKTKWPLLGATLVGIMAFAAISLSQDSTGEYTRSLFYVILISLILSWILAMLVAPLFCHLLMKPKSMQQTKPMYQSFLYRGYKVFLCGCIKLRWMTVGVMVVLLALSLYGFGFVKQSFFPNSTTPIFYVNFWRAQSTDIRTTVADVKKIEQHIIQIKNVTAVTSLAGTGATRFLLVYSPEKPNSSYAQLLVRVAEHKDITAVAQQISNYLITQFPDSEPKIELIRLGPGGGAKIEARFMGPDVNVLRQLSNEAQAIMRHNPRAKEVRDDWRQRVKVIEPVYSEQQARLTGITRTALTEALATAFSGKEIALYREGDELIPIISRPPATERLNIGTIDGLEIWSPILNKTVPISQVVTGFKTTWQDAIIRRRNRIMTITASCEPVSVPASVLFNELQPKIAALKLPAGYELQWGGEYEDSHDAQVALWQQLPVSFIIMILIVIFLFSTVRQPLIIWLCVPLSFIGVSIGLLATNLEFGFMALLGFLSLTGMLIKNAIVLVDEIDREIREGKEPFAAIIGASLSRARPVLLAAITTVLGMIPLLFDAFFVSMAVTIMVGLSFATLLTLIVVPVLYSIFFKIKYSPAAPSQIITS